MLETLKKTFYAGIGAAVISKDAVESALADLVKKGKLSTEDAKAFLEKATDRGEKSFSKTKDDLAALAQKFPFVRAEQLSALERRVAAIEEKLGIAVPAENPETPAAEENPGTPENPDVPAQ